MAVPVPATYVQQEPFVEVVKPLGYLERAVRKVALRVPASRTNSSRHPEEPAATNLQAIQYLGRMFQWSSDLRKMDALEESSWAWAVNAPG